VEEGKAWVPAPHQEASWEILWGGKQVRAVGGVGAGGVFLGKWACSLAEIEDSPAASTLTA
jgi:hypothetical protein